MSGRPWWEQVIRGERQGFWAKSLLSLARLGSLGYAAGARGHRLAYERGWLTAKRLAQPTICVGNITAGGTGKTPLVMKLCRDLLARGLKPAVLLRGYKRLDKKREPLLVRDADRLHAAWQESGDEAMELALRLPGVCIGVGSDRYHVGTFIQEQHPVDCFILDDGFQHHALARDINIVAMDVTDPWGGGRLLPAGLLRESPQALKRADAVVLTRTALVGPDRLSTLRHEVSQHLAPGSCLLESRHEPQALVTLASEQTSPLSALRGQAVLSVSGIGNPEAFDAGLRQLGAVIVGRYHAADHSHDAARLWRWVQKHWQPGQWVLMTEKDAIRWRDAAPATLATQKTFALRMELVLDSGAGHWEKLLAMIQALAHA